ncbi:phage tail assembly protein [Halomonas sp.]|uniref:phage tail assembly protein n=1 Tax=Halomonas sp. TaxID=1486246 RepID=UPI00257D38A3|nr:phage tail assembly protein [Halomonas sp.]MCJ8285101.1 phage tail assembly protein [Halomonas sp.]NQY70151.1 phage tail assembly protein [Halomonas sp.]
MDDNLDTLHDQIDGIELTEDEEARIDDQGDAMVVTLVEPLTYRHSKLEGERTVETLRLPKRVKGKHLKKMDQAQGEIGKGLALVAALASVPAHAMDELDARDMDLCLVAVEPFLPKRRKTGRR